MTLLPLLAPFPPPPAEKGGFARSSRACQQLWCAYIYDIPVYYIYLVQNQVYILHAACFLYDMIQCIMMYNIPTVLDSQQGSPGDGSSG